MKTKMLLLSALICASNLSMAADTTTNLQTNLGSFVATGLSDFKFSGLGGLSIGFAWPVSPKVRMGIRQSFNISWIPYGNYDGEPTPGVKHDDSFEHQVTLLPSTYFSTTIDASDRISLDLSVGVGFLASSSMGVRSILPYPALGAGLQIALARYEQSSLCIRAGLDAMYMAFYDPKPMLLMPQVGISYIF